jgi:hypothetical protein
MDPEDNINDIDNQQQNNQQNQQQDVADKSNMSQTESEIDASLESFFKASERDIGKTPADKTKEAPNQQQEVDKGKQQTQPNNQQQQTRPNEQGTRENQQNEQIPTTARQFGTLFRSDTRGNIYDAKGQLIAPAGAGHKQFRRLYPYIERAENEAAGYKSKVENYERATAAAKEAGLSLDEQSASLSLMVAYKKDPKTAIKFLLQQAQERGIDTSDIVQGGGGLDAATLRSAVQEVVSKALEPFAPIIEQTQQQRQMQELQEEAAQVYTEFFESKPDAGIHKGPLASVMQQTGYDLQTAYYELKTDVLSRGLDWTKPLAPQYTALRTKGGNNRQPNGGGQDQILPDMNGRTGNSSHVDHNSRRQAAPDDSWNSIIEDAVAEVVQRQQARQ